MSYCYLNILFPVGFKPELLTRNVLCCAFILFSISPPVILNSSRRLSAVAVCFGLLSETCVAQACKKLPWSVQDTWTFHWTSASSDRDQMSLNSGTIKWSWGAGLCQRKGSFWWTFSTQGWRRKRIILCSRENGRRDVIIFSTLLRMRKRSMFILQGCQFVFYLTFRVDSELISQDSYEIFLCDLITPWREAPERSYGTSRAPSSKFIQFPGPLCKNDTNTEPEVVIWQ